MSLINRIALCNYSNADGEDSADWNPRFRYEVLDFLGQSAVVNLSNGGGKTTAANAVIGLLSRHPVLLARAKEHAAPQKVGYWSHIQVELIEPLHGALSNDMLTAIGEPVTGEAWVFGMAMSRDSDSNDYYYYQGKLEDLAPAIRKDGKLSIQRNDSFREQSKGIKGIEWGVTREGWRAKIGQHIPVESLMGLAEFQLKGGSDKDAPIFKLAQTRSGRPLHELFFYEIIAPELLHEVLDDDTEESSGSIDHALFHQIREMVRTRHLLDEQKTKVDEMETAVQHLSDTAELSASVIEAASQYQDHRRGCALDIAVLDDLVRQRPIPGVPQSTLPGGKLGEVVSHLVVPLGESAPRITDAGLALLFGKETKVVNQAAGRLHISGAKITQVIEIPCDLAHYSKPAGGHKTQAYTIEQATNLLRKHVNEDAIILFEEAVSWFDYQADTNPYRRELMEAEADQDAAIRTVNDQGKRIEELQKESLRLSESKQQVQADQAAFDELKGSGRFTEQELQDPKDTRERVLLDEREADRALSGFEQRFAKLEDSIPVWERYCAEYGEEKPDSVDKRLSELESEATNAYEENRTILSQVSAEKAELEKEIIRLGYSVSNTKQDLEKLTNLEQTAKPILETLGDNESPVGLEARRRQDLKDTEKALQDCENELNPAKEGVKAFKVFQKLVPGVDPGEWLQEAERKRDGLALRKNKRDEKYHDLVRRREALDVDTVAANKVAQDALDCLVADDIPHECLHNFILTLSLPDKRQRDLLGMFSSQLFAPVIQLPDQAVLAAERLEQAELPVPVFLAQPLAEFSRDSELTEHDQIARTGLIAGRITRQVECIFDPGLVDREKEKLDQLIADLKSDIEALAIELERISPEGELVTAARAAKVAIDAGYLQQIESLADQHALLSERLELCQSLLTDEMTEGLRAAEEFWQAGGLAEVERMDQLHNENRQAHSEAIEKENEANNRIIDLQGRDKALKHDAENAYPDSVKEMVKQSITFFTSNGPEFMADADANRQALENSKSRATERAKFERLFERAARWLAYQTGLESADDIDELIGNNNALIQKAEEDRRKANQAISEIEGKLPSLRKRVSAIDSAAIALLAKYKRAAVLARDYRDAGITEADLEDHPIGDVAWRLREAIEQSDDTASEIAEELESKVGESSIDSLLEEIGKLRETQEALIANFNKKTVEVSGIKGLAEVERDRLKNAKGIEGAHWVKQFSNQYWQLYTKAKDELDKLSADERAVNTDFAERLSLLMEAASDNLAALKKVASKDPEGMISHFVVKAKVASREEMTGIIERIVHEVDVYERRRREDEEDNRLVDRNRAQSDLQARIRETLYHSVFRDVSVMYANNQIRRDGKPHLFESKLSTGQKNALLMMWVLRLAQYRVEREARKRITGLSRSRVRKQAQSIMIIDGLFSNLSDPKLIRSVMSSLTVTRGHFQLIGLVHDPKYQHDFNLFPVFLIGKTQESKGWVSFDRVDESGALAFAKLQRRQGHAAV